MCSQLTLVHTLPLEVAGESGSLMFGGALPLAVPKVLLASMWRQVDEGVRLLPKRGAEIGGLLVGPKSRENGVVVDTIMPLAIEYKHGPSFRISDADCVKLSEMIEAVQSDPGKAVVGFYRSQTRGNETFRESDREICAAIEKIHTSFGDDFLSYFVLAPVSRAEKLAHVSMWNGSDWDRKQFVLRWSNLPAVPAPPPPAARERYPAEATPRELVPAVYDYPEPSLVSTPRTTARVYATPGIAGAVLLLSTVGFWGYHAYQGMLRNRATATVTASPATRANLPPLRMGFSADRQGGLWKLSWDRGTMDVLNPGGALLDIQDGDASKQLHLTPADLNSGTVFYTPSSGDLRFSLQLELPGAAPIEEHVRILEGPPSVPESAASTSAAPNKPAARAPNTTPADTAPPLEEPPDLVP